MAEIISSASNDRSPKRKKHVVKMDMTPMVDLAFLLLTFFVLAASLAKPKAVEIIYPENEGPHTPLNQRSAITLLIGEKPEQLFYYQGAFDPHESELVKTDFSTKGLRSFLFERNKSVNERVQTLKHDREEMKISQADFETEYAKAFSDRDAPFVIVKTMPTTKFENVIAAMDELNITGIRKRVVQGMSDEEAELVKSQ